MNGEDLTTWSFEDDPEVCFADFLSIWNKAQELSWQPLSSPPQESGPAVDIDELGWASFHAACVQKMAAARTKGRCGWNDPQQCSGEHLAAMLREHLGKGNQGTFEDVANFCMMLHQRGEDPVILRYPIINDYGDAWYDGFMAAVKEAKSHDVECYTEADVLQLSEGAESEFEQRLAKKGGE